MVEINIPGLLYSVLVSVIVWFVLWFAYAVMDLSKSLAPAVFTNLNLATCLIVFIICMRALGGIERT